MATLHEKKVKFNSKMMVSNTGGNLSTDSGLILVKEFMDPLNFSDLSKQHLEIEDKRLYQTHDNFSLMEQLIYQNIAGYSTDSSANLLKQDLFSRWLWKNPVLPRKLHFPDSGIAEAKKIFLSYKVLTTTCLTRCGWQELRLK